MVGMKMAVKVKEKCKKCFHFQVCASVLQNDLFIREVMLGEKEPECKQFVEVVHGKWEIRPHLYRAFYPEYCCSACGGWKHKLAYEHEGMNYCPNCGAKMDKRRVDSPLPD